MIYHAIGKAVVRLGTWYVMRRYGSQLRVALGALVVGAGVAAYVAARDVQEG